MIHDSIRDTIGKRTPIVRIHRLAPDHDAPREL